MNLYIWDDDYTLTDYMSGIIFVIAHNLKEANELISNEVSKESYRTNHPTEVISLGKINEEPRVWFRWGSA